jgi:hypothetical protein
MCGEADMTGDDVIAEDYGSCRFRQNSSLQFKNVSVDYIGITDYKKVKNNSFEVTSIAIMFLQSFVKIRPSVL